MQGCSAPFHVCAVAGKGMGCIASRQVDVGERVLCESPLFSMGPTDYKHGVATAVKGGAERGRVWGRSSMSVRERVDALSPGQKAIFFGLSQNEERFGTAKAPEGIWATNALPCHCFSQGYSGIFPLAARMNHSCAPNVAFHWSPALGALTIHASQPISVGEELVISYGFPPGCLLRSQRQERLWRAFGFTCTCAKCTLQAADLERSEARLSQIGDKTAVVRELHEATASLPSLLAADPARLLLATLDAKYALMREECPAGLFPGLECYLQAFVEACEAAAQRLCDVELLAPPPPPGQQLTSVSGVPLRDIRGKSAHFLAAAHAWAIRAAEATRLLKGEDSLAFEVWQQALQDGCWTGGREEIGRASLAIGPEREGRTSFFWRWANAGLSAPPPQPDQELQGIRAGGGTGFTAFADACSIGK